jgi:hypothetical protein
MNEDTKEATMTELSRYATGGVLVFAGMVAATSFVTAQSKSTEGAKSAAFEVASVKPNNTTTHPGIAFPPGRFSAINVPLKTLVLAAFNLQDFQLLEAPGWTASSRIRESMTDCD